MISFAAALWSVGRAGAATPCRITADPVEAVAFARTDGADVEACFLDLARDAYKTNDFPSSLPHTRALVEAMRGTPLEGLVLSQAALLVWAARDHPGAAELYRQALTLGPPAAEEVALRASLTEVLRLAGQPDAAIEAGLGALALLGDAVPASAVDLLVALSRAQIRAGRFDDAEANLHDAERRAAAVGPKARAAVLYALGDLLEQRDRLPEAAQAYREAVTVHEPSMRVDGWTALGSVLVHLQEFDAAEQALARGLEARAQRYGPLDASVASSWVDIAAARHARLDLVGAEAAIGEALAIAAQTGRAPPFPTWITAARVAVSAGRLGDARTRLEHARAAAGDDPARVHAIRVVELRLSTEWGHTRALAEQLHRDAVASGDPSRIDDAAIALATEAERRADLDTARTWYRAALDSRIDRYGRAHPLVAKAMTLLADTVPAEERRALLEGALQIKEQAYGPDSPWLGTSLLVLAEEVPPDERVVLLERACASFARADPAAAQRHRCEVSLGALRVSLGDLGGLELAEAAWAALGPDRNEAQTWTGWSVVRARWMAGDPSARALADDLLRRRLDVVDLGALSTREAEAAVAYRSEELGLVFDVFADPADSRRAWDAWVAWRDLGWRAARRAALGSAPAPGSEAVRSARAELSRATLAGGDVPAAQRALDDAERAFAQVSLEEPPPLQTICEALGPSDTVVAWTRLPDARETLRYTAFVVDAACNLRRIDLGPAAEIDALAVAWRERIAAGATDRADRVGEELRARAWDPLGIPSGAAVRLIPDGALASVSWAGVPSGGGRYLVEDHTMRSLDGVRDLVAAPPTRTGRGAVVVGGVAFGPAVGARLPCGAAALTPLPSTLEEATRVARLLRGPVVRLLGADATEGSVAGAVVGRDVVHLATHGLFADAACRTEWSDRAQSEVSPLALSGVALAGIQSGGDAVDDGFWTASEISAVDLTSVGLVVLSACDTGLGEVRSGSGVVGLRRALTVAGARAHVTSLWSVPDEATSVWMTDFYRALRRGDDPERAARAAQLDALAEQRSRGDAAPGRWAAWVVSGPTP